MGCTEESKGVGRRMTVDMRDLYLKDLQTAIIRYYIEISGDVKYKGSHIKGIVDTTLLMLKD